MVGILGCYYVTWNTKKKIEINTSIYDINYSYILKRFIHDSTIPVVLIIISPIIPCEA